MRYFLALIALALISLSQDSTIHAKTKTLTFSPQAKLAIGDLAKNILINGNNPAIDAVKPQLDPQDYKTAKDIGLLPDSPFYIVKSTWRNVSIFFTFDPAQKAFKRLKYGNQKTLESLLVLEKARGEKDVKKQQKLIDTTAKTLDSVGKEFDAVSANIDSLKAKGDFRYLEVEDEAFRYAGYWLKHQVLLQQQEDKLNEQDFLKVEAARIKHLNSIAHIVVLENKNPLVLGHKLAQLISPQVGSNFASLATIAQLRDLEISASTNEQKPLRNTQRLLQKELEIKLSKLTREERLKQVQRYVSFIHGNPVRQFAAYNQISKSFTSDEMKVLTSAFKDKAAQNFRQHLNHLDSEESQKQFISTLFSSYPVDLRLVLYTEVQLKGSKVLAAITGQDSNNPGEQQKAIQLERLQQIKALLGNQVCQKYGQNPQELAQTRFYTQSIIKPDILDVRISQFLSTSIQNCDVKSAETLKLVNDLQTAVNNNFIAEAKESAPASNKRSLSTNKLPTRAQAAKILEEENVQAKPAEAQKVAEEIIQETQEIVDTVSENTAALEQEVADVIVTVPTEANNQTEAVVSDAQTIIDETLASAEPTQDEIAAKEEEIIEQIEDAAASGGTSPLVEELPQEVQEEISQETGVPLPTPSPSVLPTPSLAPSPTTIPTVQPTAVPTPEPTPSDEPTLIETITSTVSSPEPAVQEPEVPQEETTTIPAL